MLSFVDVVEIENETERKALLLAYARRGEAVY